MDRHTVLDFDGTLTDIEKEAVYYVRAYKSDISKIISLSGYDFENIWKETEAKIKNLPEKFGWLDRQGRIVAPATSDPLILSRVIADQLLITLRNSSINIKERCSLLDELYMKHYPKMETHFKHGAKEFLKKLSKIGHISIITNSTASIVMKKLNQLGVDDTISVVGGAKKYEINSSKLLNEIDQNLDCLPNLNRKVFTQRKQYYEALKTCGSLKAQSTVVAGDVWELDLMLPALLNIKTVLMVGPTTPNHELNIMKSIGNDKGRIAYSIEDLFEHIGELHNKQNKHLTNLL